MKKLYKFSWLMLPGLHKHDHAAGGRDALRPQDIGAITQKELNEATQNLVTQEQLKEAIAAHANASNPHNSVTPTQPPEPAPEPEPTLAPEQSPNSPQNPELEIIRDGLIGLYLPENLDPNELKDLSPFGNHGTPAYGYEMPTTITFPNRHGKGKDVVVLNFQANSGIILPDSLNLDGEYSVFVAAKWISGESWSLQNQNVDNLWGRWGLGLLGQANGVFFRHRNGHSYLHREPLTDNDFDINVLMVGNGQSKSFLNGEQVGSLSQEIYPPGPLAIAQSGHFKEPGAFNLAALIFYDRVLSSSEREQNESSLRNYLAMV